MKNSSFWISLTFLVLSEDSALCAVAI